MTDKFKIIIAIVLTIIVVAPVTYLLTRAFSTTYTATGGSSDTSKVTRTNTIVDSSQFTIEKDGGIIPLPTITTGTGKTPSLPSDQGKGIILSGKTNDSTSDSTRHYTYYSNIDTTICFKDSLGNITDSLHVTGIFTSPIPLSELCRHIISITRKYYHREKEINSTINNTVIVDKNNFWDIISAGPGAAFGWDATNKKFTSLVGIVLKIDLSKILGGF